MIRILVVIALAALCGCAQKPSWQQLVWEDGFIPLPTLGVVRLTAPDDASPTKFKQVTKYVLVGTYRPAEVQDFRRGPVPWLWRDVPSLTETALPVELIGGAEKYEDKIGLKINLEALVRVADVTVDLGPSKSLTLSKFWFLQAPAVENANAHLVLEPMAGEIRRGEADKTYFLLTKALGGDVADTTSLVVKLTGKAKDSPAKGGIEGGPSFAYTAQGVVLGVQGQIVTRRLRSLYLAGPTDGGQLITKGSKAYALGGKQEDVLDIRRDDQNRLHISWRGVPGAGVFAAKGSRLALASDGVPADSTWVLVGNLKPDGWRLLSLQLRQTDDGSPAITAAGAYEVSLRVLDSSNLVAHFEQVPDAAKPAAQARVSVDAWRTTIGSDKVLPLFTQAQEQILAFRPDPEAASIRRYDIAQIISPVDGDAAKHDLVRAARYDVRGQGGKKFNYEVYYSSDQRLVRNRLWAQKADGTLHDLTPKDTSFRSPSVSIAIPSDVDYLYMRSAVRQETLEVNAVGFHGGRHAPVQAFTWDTAFVAPLGRQCRLVLGEERPDAPQLGARSRGQLPEWARQLIAQPAGALEEEVRAVQKIAQEPLDLCHFSVSNSGSKVAWILHAE